MRLTSPTVSPIGLLAAIGAGLAAVLLATVSRQGSLALIMGFVAPLPLMIASLGFGTVPGVVAAVVGTLFIGAVELKLGLRTPLHMILPATAAWGRAGLTMLVFSIYLAIPALVIGRLAALPIADGKPMRAGETMRPEERHIGLVLAAIAVFGAFSVAILIAFAGGIGSFDARVAAACRTFVEVLAKKRPLPAGTDVAELTRLLAWFVPPVLTMLMVVIYSVNVWIAARVSQISGMLGVPWPDLPRHLKVPSWLAAVLAVAAGLSFLGGTPGLVCRVVASALLAVFALEGLAVTHQLSRGKWFRSALLFTIYFTLVLLNGWPLAFWGLVGVVDAAFSFRDRQKPAVRSL